MTFEQIQGYLNNIPNIHYGGCGIAALAMKRAIKKHIGDDVTIFYGFYDYGKGAELAEMNKAAIADNKPDNATACCHAGILYNDQRYDCNGIWERIYPIYINMPEDLTVASLNKPGTWNPDFHRKYVRRIEKELDIDLSDIDITIGRQ